MMGIHLYSILTVFIVNFLVCTTAKSYYQTVDDQVNFHNSLKEKEAQQRQVFAQMKKELMNTQIQNAFRRKRQIGIRREVLSNEPPENATEKVPPYITDENELKILFRKYYPEARNVTTETWPDVITLDYDTLEKICNQILNQFREFELSKYFTDYTYMPVDPSELFVMRVIRSAPFRCDNKVYDDFYKQEGLTVAICQYDNYKFYIAPAGDHTKFFRLRSNEHGVFVLKSGLHHVVL